MKTRYVLFNWFYYAIVFVFFVFFFTRIHPIAPFDSDDWSNMILERPSFPSLDCWNPTKVFPERFEPFVSTIAGYLIVPLVGDYIGGLILANSIVVAFFIIIYLLFVHRYIITRFQLNPLICLALITIFILLHFLILRTAEECNEYLLYSNDSNCYYHYIMPNLLCASLVIWLMHHDIRIESHGRTIATLLVFIYLALCSNLYSVTILISYIGSVLLIDLKTFSPSRSWLTSYIKRNAPFLIVIVLWVIIQWIESNGIRANCYGYLHKSFIRYLKETCKIFLTIRYNHWFLTFSILALVAAKLLKYRLKRYTRFWRISYHEWVVLLSLGLSIVYLILLSSRVNPTYVQRGDVIFEYAFFFLWMVIMALAYICTHFRQASWVAPLFILFLFFQSNTHGRTFKDVSEKYPPNIQCSIRLDQEIVTQIIDADAKGQDSVVINVPIYPYGENWPIMTPRHHSQYYGIALYKHNRTKREITTIFIPAYEIE
ncbi:MAG: hypothetical protein II670_14480 [Alphaproteobacteria bacterium]|nr:hypothetical protein [Alphaproteobacteria bacterium]